VDTKSLISSLHVSSCNRFYIFSPYSLIFFCYFSQYYRQHIDNKCSQLLNCSPIVGLIVDLFDRLTRHAYGVVVLGIDRTSQLKAN